MQEQNNPEMRKIYGFIDAFYDTERGMINAQSRKRRVDNIDYKKLQLFDGNICTLISVVFAATISMYYRVQMVNRVIQLI